jgi:short-subunit dehydrogenase
MNKLIVVSGGTRGIGRAIIQKFMSQGYDVATCARNTNELLALKLALESDFPSQKVFIFTADLALKTQTKAFANEVLALNRPIDVLVNNTGVFVQGSILTEDDGLLEQQIETNVYSAYYLTKYLIDNMIAQKNGYVVNICSIASLMAYKASGSYSISKFAMLGFSKSLREELKPHHIKVSSVMPGAVFTDAWAGVPIAEERFMKANDIAEILWTCNQLSPAAVVEEIVMRPMEGDF